MFLITLLCFLCGERYWFETAASGIIHLLHIHTHILSTQSFVQQASGCEDGFPEGYGGVGSAVVGVNLSLERSSFDLIIWGGQSAFVDEELLWYLGVEKSMGCSETWRIDPKPGHWQSMAWLVMRENELKWASCESLSFSLLCRRCCSVCIDTPGSEMINNQLFQSLGWGVFVAADSFIF